jgi:uncharacterized membrane protein
MSALLDHGLALHRFLSRNLFYPLALCTALVLGFYVGRVLISDSTLFLFLIKNLALAWIPYLMAVAFDAVHRRGWLGAIAGSACLVVWLAFLPNGFYIMTDLIHLHPRPGVPLWYDAGFIAFIAWTGLLLAVVSLYRIQQFVAAKIGWLWSWFFALPVLALSGYGVYLGRFQRWNSWDLWTTPIAVLKGSLAPIIHPLSYADKLGFIFLFSSLFLAIYVVFVWLRKPGFASQISS